MADLVEGALGKNSRAIDLGSGFGGAARYLAKRFGCQVTCLNISEVENERNRKANAAAGLDKLIDVKHGTFEEIPENGLQASISPGRRTPSCTAATASG